MSKNSISILPDVNPRSSQVDCGSPASLQTPAPSAGGVGLPSEGGSQRTEGGIPAKRWREIADGLWQRGDFQLASYAHYRALLAESGIGIREMVTLGV